MKKVLIVDDNVANLEALGLILQESDYSPIVTSNPNEVVSIMKRFMPDIVIIDVSMPEMDGFEVYNLIKDEEQIKNIPVIFANYPREAEYIVKCFQKGAVDYVSKPYKKEEVLAKIKTHLRLLGLQKVFDGHKKVLERRVIEQVEQISKSQMQTIFALAKLAQSRDDDTGEHLDRVQKYCYTLMVALRNNPKYTSIIDDEYIKNVANASMLHDIGKVGVPDAVLLKPGKLTDEEFEIMKKHTIIGFETLEMAKFGFVEDKFIEIAKIIVKSHHERWDGSGYPDKLKGEDIPLAAKIMAVADVYDALSTKRSYKEAFPHEKCVDIIKQGSGTQFAPEIVDAFLEVEREFDNIRSY